MVNRTCKITQYVGRCLFLLDSTDPRNGAVLVVFIYSVRPHSRKSLLSTRLYIRCLKKKIPLGDPPGPSGGGISNASPRNEAAALDPSCGHSANWSRWSNRKGLLFVNQEQQGELNPSASDRLAGGRGRRGARLWGRRGCWLKRVIFALVAGRMEDAWSPGVHGLHDPRVRRVSRLRTCVAMATGSPPPPTPPA